MRGSSQLQTNFLSCSWLRVFVSCTQEQVIWWLRNSLSILIIIVINKSLYRFVLFILKGFHVHKEVSCDIHFIITRITNIRSQHSVICIIHINLKWWKLPVLLVQIQSPMLAVDLTFSSEMMAQTFWIILPCRLSSTNMQHQSRFRTLCSHYHRNNTPRKWHSIHTILNLLIEWTECQRYRMRIQSSWAPKMRTAHHVMSYRKASFKIRSCSISKSCILKMFQQRKQYI